MRFLTPRLGLLCLVLFALALTGCMSGLTKHGALVKFGDAADASHRTILDQDAGLLLKIDPNAPSKPPTPVPPQPSTDGDLLLTIAKIVGLLVGGAATGYATYKGVGYIATKTQWSPEEIHDIQNPTTLPKA